MQRIGREMLLAETVRNFLGEWYFQAVTASGIRPIAEPDLNFDKLPEKSEDPFTFTATVQVAPKPKLPEIGKLEVERPQPPDMTPHVERMLDATLTGAGTLKATGEPAKEGDEVVVDFECLVDGTSVRGASATGYQARQGDGRLLDELEAAILGTKAGETLEVPVNFTADHPMPALAGNDAVFSLKLREVAQIDLPKLTDEVAKKVSEFDTAKDLRADIEAAMNKRVEKDIEGLFRANAVSKLAESAEVAEPQPMVDQRQQEIYGNMRNQLAQMGMTIEAYLSMTGKDQTEFFDELTQQARDDVRRELCLLALAEDLDVEVTDEDLKAEIREHITEGSPEDAEQAIEHVFQSGRTDLLRSELLMQRTIDHLVKSVKSVKGKPLDAEPAEAEAEAAPAT
jgi:trigger factor